MGIQGLLKGMADFSEKKNITDFSNQILAVDTSSWLHKSVYSISKDYVEATERSKTTIDPKCLRVSTSYVVRRCQELLHHAKIKKIYLVMDGTRCPLKAITNQDREQRRQANLTEARKLMREGRTHKAEEKYRTCIKINASFANAVANEVKNRMMQQQQRQQHTNERVKIIQSPYEADAQLVKLCVDGLADAIVTEDSDVLVYNAVCRSNVPIIFKLDRNGGACDVISMKWLFDNIAQPKRKDPKKTNAMFSVLCSLISREARRPGSGVRLFVQSCVLTGSDYSPSRLHGVGLVTAFKLLKDQSHRTTSERFIQTLSSLSKKRRANQDMIQYEENLSQSEAVFYHHPVLQLKDNSVVPLVPFRPSDADDQIDFNPNLARFDGNISFLGSFSDSQSNQIIPSSQQKSAIGEEFFAAVKQIVCKPMKRKPSLSKTGSNNPVENPYKKRRLESHPKSTELDDDLAILMNQNNKTTNSTTINDEVTARQPFAKVDANTTKDASSAANIFSHFAHGTAPRPDARYVKPQFDSTGRRLTTNMRQKLEQLKSHTATMAVQTQQQQQQQKQKQKQTSSSSSRNHELPSHRSPNPSQQRRFGLLHHSFASFGSPQHQFSDTSLTPGKVEQSGLSNRSSEIGSDVAGTIERHSSVEPTTTTAQSQVDSSRDEQIFETNLPQTDMNGVSKSPEASNDPVRFDYSDEDNDDESIRNNKDIKRAGTNTILLSTSSVSDDGGGEMEDRGAWGDWAKNSIHEGSSNELAIDVDDDCAPTSKYFRDVRRVTLDSPEQIRSGLKTDGTLSPGGHSSSSEIEEPQIPIQPVYRRPVKIVSVKRRLSSSSSSEKIPQRRLVRRKYSPQSNILDHFKKRSPRVGSSPPPAVAAVPSAPKKISKRPRTHRKGAQITHHFTYKSSSSSSSVNTINDEWVEL